MDDRASTAALLRTVHSRDGRFADTAWLDWLYDENPVGPAFEQSRDLGGERIGHFAAVPQHWRQGPRRVTLLCGVNAATAPGRGRMVFAALATRILRAAVTDTAGAGFGVTNDASSVPSLGRLRGRLHGPLPIVVARPGRPVGVQSAPVDATTLSDGTIGSLVADVSAPQRPGWRQEWTADTLTWRLSAPGARYALHWSDEVVAVSARTSVRRIPVGVLMKLLPRRGPVPAAVTRRIVGAIHRHHRVPAVVYVGFNGSAEVGGIRAPRRVRPGPLNLIVVGTDTTAALLRSPELASTGVSSEDLVLETFELLDFDAL